MTASFTHQEPSYTLQSILHKRQPSSNYQADTLNDIVNKKAPANLTLHQPNIPLTDSGLKITMTMLHDSK